VVVFEGAIHHRASNLKHQIRAAGVQRLCCNAFIRWCSRRCTVLSVTALEIGASRPRGRRIIDDDIGLYIASSPAIACEVVIIDTALCHHFRKVAEAGRYSPFDRRYEELTRKPA
jgi:hypothetical protein